MGLNIPSTPPITCINSIACHSALEQELSFAVSDLDSDLDSDAPAIHSCGAHYLLDQGEKRDEYRGHT